VDRSQIWKFNDNVDTDQIIPSQYLLLPTIDEMKAFAFEPILPDFAKVVKSGDIIIAGENFGCGSSREQAPRILKELGIRAVIAMSFSRIFFRNAINIGLPAIICKEAYNAAHHGDQAELDLSKGSLKIENNILSCTKLSPIMQRILDHGGLVSFLNEEVL